MFFDWFWLVSVLQSILVCPTYQGPSSSPHAVRKLKVSTMMHNSQSSSIHSFLVSANQESVSGVNFREPNKNKKI